MPGAPPTPADTADGPAPSAKPPVGESAPTAAPPRSPRSPRSSRSSPPMQRDTASSLPVIDLAPLLLQDPASVWDELDGGTAPPSISSTCASIAASLVETGCVLVRDPRAAAADAASFLDLLERYFAQPAEVKAADVRPDLHYQVGATPEGIEEPACLRSPRRQQEEAALSHLSPASQPHWPAGADPKWRFFWRVGERPTRTAYPELNAPPVIPAAFSDSWSSVLDGWGTTLLAAIDTVARAAAVGLGLRSSSLADLLAAGPHLLAPTGSDLGRHRSPGTVLAGYHSDLNLLTVHSKGRLPGLFVWTRGGDRLPVSIPPGCLLLQAGLQLEHVTGGAVVAGRHEVVVTPEALAAVDAALAAGGGPPRAWRVSSTLFAHAASDALLTPLGPFADRPGASDTYPPIAAGAFVQRELEAINLKKRITSTMRPAVRLLARRAAQALSLAEAALPAAARGVARPTPRPPSAFPSGEPGPASSARPPPAMGGPGHLSRRGGRPPPLGAASLASPPATRLPPLDDGRRVDTAGVAPPWASTAPDSLLGASPSSPRPPGGVAMSWLPSDLELAADEGQEMAGGSPEEGASAEDAPPAADPPPGTPAAAPSLTAAPHDAKLSLFYRVYGDPASGAPGRDEAARAARDTLALFHAIFGPAPGGRPRAAAAKEEDKKKATSTAATPPAPAPTPLSSSPSNPARLTFPSRLLRGTVLARPNRFTMTVRLEDTGEVVHAHCPVTGSLGGLGLSAFDGAGVPCLVSRAGDPSGPAATAKLAKDNVPSSSSSSSSSSPSATRVYARRTRHTVEAVCLADPASLAAAAAATPPGRPPPPTPWIGINQLAANRYVEHFMRAGALPALVPDPAGLAREVPVPGGSRLDFVYQGRDLVEVKSPLEALPLLAAAGGGGGGAAPSSQPNPALVAALAARRANRGSLLSRYPVARRAAMYERAARHAAALAEHLTAAKERERRAARAASRKAAQARAGQQAAAAAGEDGTASPRTPLPPPAPPKKARAMLVHCFQFDAPPVRRAIPAPSQKTATTSASAGGQAADGRAAVIAAMREAAAAGVEVWQVNLRIDPDGVTLDDCFQLDLFADERRAAAAAARAASRGRARRVGGGRRAAAATADAAAVQPQALPSTDDAEEECWSEDDGRWVPAAAAAGG